jgi:hypothetical protein
MLDKQRISKCLYQHNKGWGAVGTADLQYRPYAVAAYICGMGHMNRVDCKGRERKWKYYNRRVNDVMDRIGQGQHIVVEYNKDQLYEEMFIRFVITIDGPEGRSLYCLNLNCRARFKQAVSYSLSHFLRRFYTFWAFQVCPLCTRYVFYVGIQMYEYFASGIRM